VVVARSENRAVKGWSNNSQMKFSSSVRVRAAVCGRALSGGALRVHWMSALHTFCFEWPYAVYFLFHSTLLTLLCPLLHEFHHQHSFPVPENNCHPSAFWQADNVCLKFFGLSCECVCIQCFHYSLVSGFTNETQVSSSVTRYFLA
jgi:hypothetical protein